MKSTLKQFVPMEQIEIPPEMLTTAPTAEEREQEETALRETTQALLRSHVKLVPVETAEEGSVVTLSLQSGLARYHRESVPVALGLGLYSTELEAAIPGRGVGETFGTTVEGEPVTVRLLSAQNRVLPTDPNAITFDRETDGAEDYAAWVALQRQKNHDQRAKDRVWSLLQHITLKMNELCEPQLDEEELAERNRVNLEGFVRQYCDILGIAPDQMGKDVLDMYREQVQGSTRWEMGDALFAIAMGLEPAGEGDEIQRYAIAFRLALQEYCKSILKEERE